MIGTKDVIQNIYFLTQSIMFKYMNKLKNSVVVRACCTKYSTVLICQFLHHIIISVVGKVIILDFFKFL